MEVEEVHANTRVNQRQPPTCVGVAPLFYIYGYYVL